MLKHEWTVIADDCNYILWGANETDVKSRIADEIGCKDYELIPCKLELTNIHLGFFRILRKELSLSAIMRLDQYINASR